MANNIKGITVEIGGNTENLNSALKSVNKTAGGLQNELKQVQKQLKFDPTSVELLNQKGTILKESISATEDKLKQLESVQEKVEEQFKNGDLGEEKYRAFQRELEQTKSKLKSLKDEQSKFGNTAGATLEAAGKKIKASGESITKVGEGVTKNVTVPIAAVGGASLAAFSEVDSSMDTVAEKTGATGKTLEGLQGIAENIATTVPTSFENAGNAVGEVSTRFGLTGQALQSVSTDFIKFSEINKTDVTESVQGVQKAMSAFGVKTADTQNVLGLLTSVSQKTGVSVSDLTNDLSSNVATFQEAHLSIGQATTLLGNFEKAGLDSGTMMSGLKKAASEYSKEGKSMSQGLGDLIKRLQSSKTETGATADAYKIFGTRGGLAFVNAAKSGKLSLSDLSSNIGQYGKTVDKTFKATEDPIDKSKVAMNQMKDALAKVGEALQTALAPIIQTIIAKLKEFTNWWKQLSPQTQQMIIKIALIAAVVGPLIIMVGKLISGIGSITSGIGFLIGHLNLTTVIILAIAAAAILIITHWTQVKTFFIGLWNTIKGLFGNIGNWFSSVFSAAASGVQSAWSGITGFFSGIWNGIKNVFSAVGGWFSNLFSTAASGIQSAWSGITGFFSGVWSGITGVFNAVGSWFGNAFDSAKQAICNTFSPSALSDHFNDVWEAVQNTFSKLNPMQWGKDLIDGIANGIKSAAQHVKDAVGGIAQNIRSFLHFSVPDEGPLVDYQSWMPDFMQGLADGINTSKYKVAQSIQGLASDMSISPAVRSAAGEYSAQTIDNSVTKAPVININGPVSVQDKGSRNATLQQLQFLAEV